MKFRISYRLHTHTHTMPMALPAATASAKSFVKKLLLFHSPHKSSPVRFAASAAARAANTPLRNKNKNKNQATQKQKQKTELLVKRRTRSDRELDEEGFSKQFGNDNSAHVPVMLGEVLDAFSSLALKSFVDCTLGAGGHSAAVRQPLLWFVLFFCLFSVFMLVIRWQFGVIMLRGEQFVSFCYRVTGDTNLMCILWWWI